MAEESRSKRSLTIVMVHGVGDAKRGAVLAEFCYALQKLRRLSWFSEENWTIGRFPYARLVGNGAEFANSDVKELIEVNWADVFRPGEGKTGILQHLLRLFFALRNLSIDPDSNPSKCALRLSKFHWAILECVSLWVGLVTMGTMLLVSVDRAPWKFTMIALAVIAILGGIAEIGARTGRQRYRWGWAWAGLFSLLGIGYWMNPEWAEPLTKYSCYAYASSQLLVVTTLLGAFIATIVAKGTRPQRAARGAYLWMPFVLITSLLVLCWVTLLGVANKFPDYFCHFNHWLQCFAASLRYDLRTAEMAMMCAETVAFVGVPVFGLIIYEKSGWRRVFGFPNEPGKAAHDMLEVFLIAAPCALFAGLLVIIGSMFCEDHNNFANANMDIMNIYLWSSLRIPALLTFLLPGIRTIGDVIGDILFHIQPDGSEVGSSAITGERLQNLLERLKPQSENPVVLLAHSQGSVIAQKLLKEQPSLASCLVTVGCPLDTLYARFLGAAYQKGFKLEVEWNNLYRDGDYVGGSVKSADSDKSIGPGPHTDYWSDQIFAQAFEACLQRPFVPVSSHAPN